MLEIDKKAFTDDTVKVCKYRVVAVGSAGSNILDRCALDGLSKEQLCAVNTDVQSLSAAVAGRKLQIGKPITRGLGTGGDPELGVAAAADAYREFEQLCSGLDLLFLCAGLGGGTGSGAAPILAKAGREAGALVVAFVTLPFQFEGRRRNEQALVALAELEALVDVVVCFENDQMGELVDARAGIHEAFAASDKLVSQSIRSIIDFTERPALMKVGVSELMEVLRSKDARCIFGFGEGSGTSAVHDALAAALKSPLMDRGRMLAEAASVLVQITGGRSMSFAEVQGLMKAMGKHLPESAQVFLGVAIDERIDNGIRLTVLAAFGSSTENPQLSGERAPQVSFELGNETAIASDDNAQQQLVTEPEEDLPLLNDGQTAPAVSFESPEIAATAELPDSAIQDQVEGSQEEADADKKQQITQEAFHFEPVSRGRFDKIEPTIIDGEDLDIPTFMRKNVRL